MNSRNVEAAMTLHRAYTEASAAVALAVFADSFTFRDHGRSLTLHSATEFRGWLEEGAAGFSGIEIVVSEYIDCGDRVVTLFEERGTNTGPFVGPDGKMPATDRHMTLPTCEILRFDTHGRIVSGDMYYDMLTVFRQLGYIK